MGKPYSLCWFKGFKVCVCVCVCDKTAEVSGGRAALDLCAAL